MYLKKKFALLEESILTARNQCLFNIFQSGGQEEFYSYVYIANTSVKSIYTELSVLREMEEE